MKIDKDEKTLLKRVSFITNHKCKRNVELFDAGLHTLHLKKGKSEQDMNFVERFLVEFIKGCKSRAGGKYKKFYMSVEPRDNYVTVWGVKNS